MKLAYVARMRSSLPPGLMIFVLLATPGCAGEALPCEDAPQPSRATLACEAEFRAQAARPLDTALPGAYTVKTIIDRADGDAVHFIDTAAYPMHRAFALDHLSYSPFAPFVNEYFLPQRRLLLGAITYYEEPDLWAYELAPYDTASAEMIADAMRRLARASFIGRALRFHPTSLEQLERAAALPRDIPIVTTEQLYAGMTYQPLHLGETYAQVRILTAAELATTYVSPREIAVLDRVPNDISVVAATVTEEFQTPLSHVNVLARQRGTPNMGLRDARALLAPHAGQWVRLEVGAFAWRVTAVTAEEAEAWWQAHRPPPTEIPAPDDTVTGILDIDDVGLADIAAVGGKAAHYGALRTIGEHVRVRDALVVPVYHYRAFLAQHAFDHDIDALLADPRFAGDSAYRRAGLADLQARMQAAPVDPAFLAALEARLEQQFPATRMKFRSSTNAEDLARHTGAGLYASRAGQVGDPARPVADALRTVWASVWSLRAVEERAYAGIDHTRVAMAVLINPSYRDEAANGVAITANIHDPGPGGADAFYINAQVGETSVVSPDPAVIAEQLMYYHGHNGQPATYYARSSLLPAGATVLSGTELFELGQALDAIRTAFGNVHDPPAGHAHLPMDVEWKLVHDGDTRRIWIKQARPYPGRGQ